MSSEKYEFYTENITEGFEFQDPEIQETRLTFLDIAYRYMVLVTTPFSGIF